MNELFSQLRAALVSTVVLAVLCCGLYPLFVYGVAQAAFRDRANGSLIVDPDGTVRGSRLLGQAFAGARYFHPRPSAAGSGYDAANSCGSNLGPTSQKLRDQIRDRIAAYRGTNGLAADATVPSDAVTASASGLDPHISPENARLQAPRVAKARGIATEVVLVEVEKHTADRAYGLLGDSAVNVLELNRALDSAASRPAER